MTGKKTGFKFLLSILCCSLCLSAAGSEKNTELFRLRMENKRLQKENDRLRKELSDQKMELLKFRQWLAATADAGKIMSVSERELHLTEIMKETVKKSNKVLTQIFNIDKLIRDILKEFPLSPARQARVLLQLEQLEKYSLQLSAIVDVYEKKDQKQALEDIRVVSVSRELKMAVLSVGSVHGIFPGLLYRSKNEENILLRVIAVRPWVCAAVPIDGNIDPLTPGMVFTAAHAAKENPRSFLKH